VAPVECLMLSSLLYFEGSANSKMFDTFFLLRCSLLDAP
jgi:hypothetical protein